MKQKLFHLLKQILQQRLLLRISIFKITGRLTVLKTGTSFTSFFATFIIYSYILALGYTSNILYPRKT